MKYIKWNEDKNELLKKVRNVCFEEFIEHIEKEEFKILQNKTHPNQKIFLIIHKNYPYCIPFVEDENKIFLKTIYPNRNYKKGVEYEK